ncbi:MAG TPA: glycosyl hydrolase [Phycisphaerae bacterium]|nr:glycosyl hydrolase [Phycisphaerae bacterium]HRY66687.1 glycosyl hydrolase [Phycisphaerae bacterium]HSA27610.1 glycosyl hydrolase [Phycisphaerae bacterium]
MFRHGWLTPTALVGLMIAGWCAAAAEEVSPASLERQFRELPMEARRWTGPLFWLHGDESKERLEMYVGKVAEGGNGCFTAESRPHVGWLEESWFRDLAICLDAAKKNQLKMWIFDEKWWPSGEVGGRVPAEHGGKRLVTSTAEFDGPGVFKTDGCGGPSFIAAVAGKDRPDGIDGASLIDLASSIHQGQLTWEAPAGHWRIIKFTWKNQPVGDRYLIDGASQASIDWYIRTVYQPHYDRFKGDFGKDILGFFYDEPEIKADWGTEVPKVLAERGVDWKKALVAFKFKLAGDEQAAAKYQYMDAFAEAWGRTMYGGISRWCRERGVLSIGHFLEHGGTYANFDLCAGDMFKLQKYSDMGGVDLVFSQLKPGQRAAYNAPCWQVPKIGSSLTHVYGKPDDVTMVEIFGARGQDLSYPEMKWWTDHVQVSGVNFLIPHSFNPRGPRDTDCPPYFYNGGFEPRWPLYRVFADYTSRLTLMLTGGRHVCPVALLYVGQSVHVGKCILPDQMSETLQDALFDCDWMPYEVFEGSTELTGKTIQMGRESFRVLVVPPVEVIPHATLAKAKDFFDRGGVIVGYGFLPTKSATLGKTAADIARLREAVWGDAQPGLAVCKTSAAGGRSYLLPEKPTPEQLQKVLVEDAGVHPTLEVVEGTTDHWLHVLHRVKADCDLFFITNQNHLGAARRFKFRITADGEPECWDAMRNEITRVPHVRQGQQVELDLTFEPSESVLLVFQPKRRPLPMRLEPDAAKPKTSITLVRDATPPGLEPKLDAASDPAAGLEGCSWVWYPEGNPVANAPAGQCFFRKQINVPEGRSIKAAVFHATADNGFVLYLNGQDAGRGDDSGDGWRNPVRLDVKPLLCAGANVLAIVAANAQAATGTNPAGLIGRLSITFEDGGPVDVKVDASWKTSRETGGNWLARGFDDASWKTAMEIARFGDAPWGRLNSKLTLSPVKADPFVGHCEISATADLAQSRVWLEMDSLAPEEAARIVVNGQDAGGFIGRPLRLEVTACLRSGRNVVKIEPFAPTSARLVLRPR